MGMVPCDALLRRIGALLMFQAKKQFQIGPTGRGKTVCMNDHTRLRDGLELCEGLGTAGPGGADGLCGAAVVSQTGAQSATYAALDHR